MKNLIILIGLIFINSVGFAQSASIEMADALYSNGKIYVVLASVLIILVGLFLYLVGLDRKVSKLERELEGNKD